MGGLLGILEGRGRRSELLCLEGGILFWAGVWGLVAEGGYPGVYSDNVKKVWLYVVNSSFQISVLLVSRIWHTLHTRHSLVR